MLASGQFSTITELAQHEKLGSRYMTRVLRLSLLAPEVVETILEGRQGAEMTLAVLQEPFPVEGDGQRGQTSQTRIKNAGRSLRFNVVQSNAC